MKKTFKTAAVLLAVTLGISGGTTNVFAGQETNNGIIGRFKEPDQASKGMMRYWLPDAGVTYEQLEKEMKDLYEAGFGGVEVTLFSSQVSFDNSTYGFGTDKWRETMKNILKIASGFEEGFRVDFTLTPCWPVAINTIDPNDLAAEQELVTAYQMLTVTSGTVDVPMADIGTADIAQNPFIIQNRLAGTVLAKVAAVKDDGTLVLDDESLQVLNGEISDKTTVAGIPDVSQLDQESEEYQYVLGLYNGEAPDTSIFFKDSAGNPIEIRKPLEDIQNYWTTNLDSVNLGDYTPSEGEDIAAGDYVLYGFYNRGNGGTTSDYSAFWSVIGSIFQDGMPGVAYWTNLMNQDAVEALTAYMDEQLFCDEELVTLIQQAAESVGISFFEDSLENQYPDGIAWTEDYAQYFAGENGYDPTIYLPFLTGSAASASGKESDYWNDYNTTISHMYQNNHVAPLQAYFNEKLGSTYRSQAYFTNDGFVLDLSATSAQVDMADVESLAFGTNFDNYRLVSAGVHLADKQYVSDEAFAIQEGIVYNLTWKRVIDTMNENFSAGANRMIFHGTSYNNSNAASEDTAELANQWPGWHAFMNLCTESWNARMPYWEDIDILADYIARTQAVLQNGTAKMDVLVYSLDSYDHEGRSRVGDNSAFCGMLDAGYSYDVVMNDGLNLAGDVLEEKGSPYKALVVNALAEASKESMGVLLRYANAGIPIIFYQNLPHESNNPTDTDEDIQAIADEILATGKAAVIASQEGCVNALKEFEVHPYAQYSQKYLRTLTKEDEDGTLYYYIYNHNEEPIETEIRLSGNGTPYILDAWSGQISPLAQYSHTDDGITATLHMDGKEAFMIAVTEDAVNFPDALANPIISTNGEAINLGPEAAVRVTQSGEITAEFEDGSVIQEEVSVPEALSLDNWNLNIDSWGPDEATDDTTDTKVTPIEVGEISLSNWNELPVSKEQLEEAGVEAMENISGIGTYMAEIEVGETDGAYLVLEHGNDMVTEILVNGENIGIPDQSTNRFDLGSSLAAGKNTIQVKLDTTLINRVRAEHSKFENAAAASYGITSAVIEPYKIVKR